MKYNHNDFLHYVNILLYMIADIQLEISINIGDKTYQLQVPTESNLPDIVKVFLTHNQLSLKYQHQILQLVKKQLEGHTNLTTIISDTKHISKPKQSIQSKKQKNNLQITQQQPTVITNSKQKYKYKNRQVIYQPNLTDSIYQQQHSNKHKQNQPPKQTNKITILDKIQNQIQKNQFKVNHNAPQCQKIYEKWKIKEKEKSNIKPKNNQQITTSPSPNKVIKPKQHQPSFFYKKGLQFQKEKQQHIQKKFKQCYPFTTRVNLQIDEKEKTTLHQKLYFQSKLKKINQLKTQINDRDQSFTKTQTINSDQFKQKITKKRKQIDSALTEIIKQGKMPKNTQIKITSKSPFRRTKVY